MGLPMNTGALFDDEAFHNCFFYFIEALDVMAMDAVSQCKAMNDFNVAWEIQHDVLDAGAALQKWPGIYLCRSEKDELGKLLAAVSALPPTALLGASKEVMNHSAWSTLRRGAAQLLKQLEKPIQRNHEFFRST